MEIVVSINDEEILYKDFKTFYLLPYRAVSFIWKDEHNKYFNSLKKVE